MENKRNQIQVYAYAYHEEKLYNRTLVIGLKIFLIDLKMVKEGLTVRLQIWMLAFLSTLARSYS